MQVNGGKLELLVPHMLRSQLLRPEFVRMSLGLGLARLMPAWAKLQFTSTGVGRADLERVLGRIGGLESWVDEWERLGREHETRARAALVAGGWHTSGTVADPVMDHHAADPTGPPLPRDLARLAGEHFLSASAAYNFAQYVVFIDVERKRKLHEACVRAYRAAMPHWDIPGVPFEAPMRGRVIRGVLRVPPGEGPRPVVVAFNGTNAVKEELHWWSDELLRRGLAVITLDGPGLGETFHRLTYVAEPRPVGNAIYSHIESHPELDPDAVGYLGMSLGGYMAIRMAAQDARVRCVAAVSPPYSADVYWNVTLVGLRKELAALYGRDVAEMDRFINRITLDGVLDQLDRPLLLAGGGHDMITPAEEAHRIFEGARCERELVFYPRAGHDCFNVLGDLRPRMVGWLARHLTRHHTLAPRSRRAAPALGEPWVMPAEAVDLDFADALRGEGRTGPEWHGGDERESLGARFSWPWARERVEIVRRVGVGAGV